MAVDSWSSTAGSRRTNLPPAACSLIYHLGKIFEEEFCISFDVRPTIWLNRCLTATVSIAETVVTHSQFEAELCFPLTGLIEELLALLGIAPAQLTGNVLRHIYIMEKIFREMSKVLTMDTLGFVRLAIIVRSPWFSMFHSTVRHCSIFFVIMISTGVSIPPWFWVPRGDHST